MPKAVLFSAVQGTLLRNGSPVSGATISRIVTWRGELHSDSTETDCHGNYHLPAITSSSNLPLLPAEFNAEQEMTVSIDGMTTLIWNTIKPEPGENTELNGLPLILTCDVADEPRFEHLLLNSIETKCRWDTP